MAKTGTSRKNPVKGSAGSINQDQLISSEERRRMIAEAAYFRSRQRGFNGGKPEDDWREAEKEINRLFPGSQQQKQERAAYDKLREGVTKVLAEARGTVNAESLKQGFDRATEELRKTGKYTTETIDKIAASLRKDMASAAEKMGPKWEAFTGKSADLFAVWRDQGSQSLAQAATAVGDWLHQAGAKVGQQVYRTGEMADSGTFECTACGEQTVLSTPAHLPPCPKCRKMEFRRK